MYVSSMVAHSSLSPPTTTLHPFPRLNLPPLSPISLASHPALPLTMVHRRSIVRSPLPNPRLTVRALNGGATGEAAAARATLVVASAAVTVVLEVANRMLYKLALVPMKKYPFFLAQVTTFGHATTPAIPILNQAFLVWQLSFAFLLLGRKYSWNKISGCLLVAAGAVIAVARKNSKNELKCVKENYGAISENLKTEMYENKH